VPADNLPALAAYTVRYDNSGLGAALDGVLRLQVGPGVTVAEATGATIAGDTVSWPIGSISGVPVRADDPPAAAGRGVRLGFAAPGDYPVTIELDYRVGVTLGTAGPQTIVLRVSADGDGDGVADDEDPFPADPGRCGDRDGDTCDDCSRGLVDPRNDGPDADADGICDAGDDDFDVDGLEGACCGTDRGGRHAASLALVVVLLLVRRRRPAPRAPVVNPKESP
jgi:hypothetical protein